MVLFIRNDGQPVARLGYGDNHPAFEFRDNVLQVPDDNAALLASLRANGYEEIDPADPRFDFISNEGWSRLAQQDYLRRYPPAPEEEPTEES